ncbi:MAG: ABC transporter transmembrane domain-containing protein, partial [Actinomycetota bacterium]
MSTKSVRLVGSGALIWPTRRLLRGVEGPFVLLVVASMVAALSQAVVLAIIVQIAMHLTESNLLDTDTGGLLGLLPDTPGALIATGFGAIITVFALELGIARLQAHLGGTVLRRLRTRLYETYADATIEAQQALRAGELAQLLTVNGAYAATATLNAAAATMALTTFVTLSFVAFLLNPAPTLIGALAVAAVLFLVRPIMSRGRTTTTGMAERRRLGEIGVALG